MNNKKVTKVPFITEISSTTISISWGGYDYTETFQVALVDANGDLVT